MNTRCHKCGNSFDPLQDETLCPFCLKPEPTELQRAIEPCPFCGENPQILKAADDSLCFVRCQRCATEWFIKSLWNSRPAAKQLESLTKEVDERREVMADIVRKLGHGCCGLANNEIVPEMVKQLSSLKADYKQALEALSRDHNALLAALNNQGGISGTERFPKPIWHEIKAAKEQTYLVLSLPSAIAMMKGER